MKQVETDLRRANEDKEVHIILDKLKDKDKSGKIKKKSGVQDDRESQESDNNETVKLQQKSTDQERGKESKSGCSIF